MTANQNKGNQNGCSAPTEQPGSGMESILDVLQLYVCQEICQMPNLTEDEKKQYCRGCRLNDLIDRVIEEHEK